MNTTDPAMIDAALTTVWLDLVVTTQVLNDVKGKTKDAKRRAALVEQYEQRIADLELDHARLIDMQLAHEAAEAVIEATQPEVKGSRAMKRAMRSAKAETTSIIVGAAGVGRSMEKLAPGCCIHTGDTRTWEIQDEESGDTYRLTLAPRTTTGVMRYIKRSYLA